MKTREEALDLLKQYNKSESHIRHAFAVEAIMRHYAEKLGEDPAFWGQVGMLHDIDYEMWPEEHCQKCVGLLQEAGYSDEFIHAVCSHGYGICSDKKPEAMMEKVLFTVDELSGLITAAAYMRPSRSVMDMETKSVKKKFKDKGFAAGVNRDIVLEGCNMLGMTLDEVIQDSIEGMRAVHESLGL